MIEFAKILEDVWSNAEPGREAAARNELVRALLEMLRPRLPAPRLTLIDRPPDRSSRGRYLAHHGPARRW
jgi:hypothetical protein